MTKPLSREDLNEIRRRCNEATEGLWISYVEGRDQSSGESFILRGAEGARREDLYLTGATVADQDFIAHARQDIPRLIDEIERLQTRLKSHQE